MGFLAERYTEVSFFQNVWPCFPGLCGVFAFVLLSRISTIKQQFLVCNVVFAAIGITTCRKMRSLTSKEAFFQPSHAHLLEWSK